MQILPYCSFEDGSSIHPNYKSFSHTLFFPCAASQLVTASWHHFPGKIKKNHPSLCFPVCRYVHYFPFWHLLSESNVYVCVFVCVFPPGPDSEPVGWSLITMEWAANGCLHCAPAPEPIPHATLCHGSPWRPVAERLGAFNKEVYEE